jgi:hypothetical protein
VHIGQHTAIEGDDVTKPGIIDFEAADDRGLASLEDSNDATLGAALRVTLDASDDAIAVHRLGEIGCGNVDVGSAFAGLGLIGNDKPESARVCGQTAHDEIHLLGQPVTVAANLQQLAGLDECFQSPSETDALVARNAQHPHQIPRGGGMMHVLPDLN